MLYADIDQLRNVQRVAPVMDRLYDRDQEALDNAACAQYDRREAIANAVTFEEVLEEMAAFTGPRAEEFMHGLRHGMQIGKNTMFVLVDQAMERVIERRLAESA